MNLLLIIFSFYFIHIFFLEKREIIVNWLIAPTKIIYSDAIWKHDINEYLTKISKRTNKRMSGM